MKLTVNQLEVMHRLQHRPLTVNQVVDEMNKGLFGTQFTYDSEHSRLRALEDRELVRRIGSGPAKWELTDKGRQEIFKSGT